MVKPGKAFCSAMAVRIPSTRAAKTTGPDAYPPTPMTSSGENPPDNPERLDQASRDAQYGRQRFHPSPSLDALNIYGLQRKTQIPQNPLFNAFICAYKQNPVTPIPSQKFLCNGNPGEKMTSRSSACDDHLHRPLPTFLFSQARTWEEMFNRIPTATRLMTRDVPP